MHFPKQEAILSPLAVREADLVGRVWPPAHLSQARRRGPQAPAGAAAGVRALRRLRQLPAGPRRRQHLGARDQWLQGEALQTPCGPAQSGCWVHLTGKKGLPGAPTCELSTHWHGVRAGAMRCGTCTKLMCPDNSHPSAGGSPFSPGCIHGPCAYQRGLGHTLPQKD